MPRRRDHASIAFILLLLLAIIFGFKFVSNWAFLTIWFCFLIGSLAPDYIEPAYHFTHRNFFHSKNLLKALFIIMIVMIVLCLILKFTAIFSITSFLAGYIIHLLLDSTTKMGLPEYNRNEIGFK